MISHVQAARTHRTRMQIFIQRGNQFVRGAFATSHLFEYSIADECKQQNRAQSVKQKER